LGTFKVQERSVHIDIHLYISYMQILCISRQKKYLVLQERSVPALRPHHCVFRLQSSRQEMSHLQGSLKQARW
jgi:hypothetical protein